MSKNHRNIRVILAATAAFSGCRAVHGPSDSDVKFIGGEEASEGQYPSSVYLQHCTAAKIGPKHFLTAAHCLYQNEILRPAFTMVPGSKGSMLVGISLEKGKQIPVTITSAVAYPGFDFATLEKDYAKMDPNAAPNPREEAPKTVDLAVVTIEEDTPELPVARIDDQPVLTGTSLTVGGYGCEAEGDEDNPLVRLKYARVPAASAKGALISWRATSETEGYRSTCHGDSGGAVYRDKGGEHLIVGVNSGSPTGFSVFTTLAGTAGQKGLAWVKERLAAPVTDKPMTFKVMKCTNAMATAPSADGVLRSYDFSDLQLAVKDGGRIAASIDRFKVTIRPDTDSTLAPYALTVLESAGCETGVLCYRVLYTEPSTGAKKLLAVQMKEGKISAYEGDVVDGKAPLGVALSPEACKLSDVTSPTATPAAPATPATP